ncbi:MAG TPA: hypothetical protein VK249_25660 [Anaerolineales bacterium]|nr:hypothetical protein [Anaerolineales bacterium]
MFNPPNSYPNSSSYDDLLKRIAQRAQRNQVDGQILAILQQSFEIELGKENIVLSRPERVRLFQDVTKVILTDVLGKIDGTK